MQWIHCILAVSGDNQNFKMKIKWQNYKTQNYIGYGKTPIDVSQGTKLLESVDSTFQ